MNNFTVTILVIILTAIITGAIIVTNTHDEDCEAAGGVIVYSHCIDREAIIEDY